MKLIIALAFLSVAAALPRPEVQSIALSEPVYPNAKIPESAPEKVKVVNLLDKLEEIAPLQEIAQTVQETVKVVDNVESNPETVKSVDSPREDEIVNEQEKVQIVDLPALADRSDQVKFVDSPAPENIETLPQEKVQFVDSPTLESSDQVKFVDNSDYNEDSHVHVINILPGFPEVQLFQDTPFDVVHFVDSPQEEHEHVMFLGSPLQITEAVRQIIERVHFVNSADDFQPPRESKYPDPLLR